MVLSGEGLGVSGPAEGYPRVDTGAGRRVGFAPETASESEGGRSSLSVRPLSLLTWAEAMKVGEMVRAGTYLVVSVIVDIAREERQT